MDGRKGPDLIRLTVTTDNRSPGSRDTHLPGHILAKVMATSVSALPAEDLPHNSHGAERGKDKGLARVLVIVNMELTVDRGGVTCPDLGDRIVWAGPLDDHGRAGWDPACQELECPGCEVAVANASSLFRFGAVLANAFEGSIKTIINEVDQTCAI